MARDKKHYPKTGRQDNGSRGSAVREAAKRRKMKKGSEDEDGDPGVTHMMGRGSRGGY